MYDVDLSKSMEGLGGSARSSLSDTTLQQPAWTARSGGVNGRGVSPAIPTEPVGSTQQVMVSLFSQRSDMV